MDEAVIEDDHLVVAVVGKMARHPQARTGAVNQAEMGSEAGIGRTGMGVQRAAGLDGGKADVKAIVGKLAQQFAGARTGSEMLGDRPALEIEVEGIPGLGVVTRIVACGGEGFLHGKQLPPDIGGGLTQQPRPGMIVSIVKRSGGEARPARQPGQLQIDVGRPRWAGAAYCLRQETGRREKMGGGAEELQLGRALLLAKGGIAGMDSGQPGV